MLVLSWGEIFFWSVCRFSSQKVLLDQTKLAFYIVLILTAKPATVYLLASCAIFLRLYLLVCNFFSSLSIINFFKVIFCSIFTALFAPLFFQAFWDAIDTDIDLLLWVYVDFSEYFFLPSFLLFFSLSVYKLGIVLLLSSIDVVILETLTHDIRIWVVPLWRKRSHLRLRKWHFPFRVDALRNYR